MKLIDIFVAASDSGEGLYAIRYDGQKEDEFSRLMNCWNDPQYLLSYFLANETHLQKSFFEGYEIDALITKVEKEAYELEQLIMELAESGFNREGQCLQEIFKALTNKDYKLYPLQKSKAVLSDRNFFPALLRLYAIRISPNAFVITGGAIKLTDFMNEHDDTQEELRKLEKVKRFLQDKGIDCEEELKLSI